MTETDWQDKSAKVIGMRITGDSAQPEPDDTLLILFSAWWEGIAFRLPSAGARKRGVTVDRYERCGYRLAARHCAGRAVLDGAAL